jgi:hypothetical protein
VIHFQSTRTFSDNDDIFQESAHYSPSKDNAGSTRQRVSSRCIPPHALADSGVGIASSTNNLPPEWGG